MKKAIALLLALVMVFALCACGGAKEEPKAEDPKTEAPAEPKTEEPKTEEPKTEEPKEVEWPTGDVTVYVPANTGAPLDLAARVAADYLAKVTGKNFVIENDSNGGGARLCDLMVEAEPDGNTLMFCGAGQIVTYFSGLWSHSLADKEAFTTVGPLVGQSVPSGAVLLTQKDKPFDDLFGMVDYIKANPNTLTVAVVNGTPHEVRLKLLFNHFEISDKVRWVSCTNNDANAGILGGTIDLAMLTETVGPQYVADGSLKAICDSNYMRNYKKDDALGKVLDEIPFLFELVDNAEELCVCWPMLIMAPGGMSDELANKINETMATIADDTEFMDRVHGLGGTNTYQYFSTEETTAIVQDAHDQCATIFEAIK